MDSSNSITISGFNSTDLNIINKPKKTGPYGLTGIMNTGNTCYMNSAIQALSHNYPLTSYLFSEETAILKTLLKNAPKIFKTDKKFALNNANTIVPLDLRQKIHSDNYRPELLAEDEVAMIYNHTITYQLLKLLRFMWGNNTVVIPTSFKKIFCEARNKFFFGDEQHDAEEAYSCILQQMQEELAECRNIKFKTTETVQEFMQYRNMISDKVKQCTDPATVQYYKDQYNQKKKEMPNESLTVESFREMKKYYGDSYSQITHIFSGFLHSSIKCPDNLCGYVSNKFESFLHLTLEIPTKLAGPVSIIDCLKDYCKEEALDDDNLWKCDGCKNNVRIIKNLSIWKSPPVLVIQLKRFKQNNFGRVVKDQRLVHYPLDNFDISCAISPSQVNTVGCTKYKLQCITNHSGIRDGGHYYTYCLESDTNQWYEFNDADVKKISTSKIITSTAYLLFYIREDMIVK